VSVIVATDCVLSAERLSAQNILRKGVKKKTGTPFNTRFYLSLTLTKNATTDPLGIRHYAPLKTGSLLIALGLAFTTQNTPAHTDTYPIGG